jgi:hypothetical protein
MRTEDLINALAADVRAPCRQLAPPAVRVGLWVVVSVPWVAIVVAVMGLRSDLAAKAVEPRWLLEQGAALTTALMATMAAFCACMPSRPRWEQAMPLVPLSLWLALLGAGCLHDWNSVGPDGMALYVDWASLPGIVLVGLVPGIAMSVMLRRGLPLDPTLSVGLGGLAASALGDFGLRLFHPQDASLMVLVWQVGTVAVLTALGAAAGHRIVHWPR